MFQMPVEWIEFVYKCHLEIIDLRRLSVHWLCVVKYELVPIDYNLVEDQLCINSVTSSDYKGSNTTSQHAWKTLPTGINENFKIEFPQVRFC